LTSKPARHPCKRRYAGDVRDKFPPAHGTKPALIWINACPVGQAYDSDYDAGRHRSQPGEISSGECHEEANLA
jgi:hypothetical protein